MILYMGLPSLRAKLGHSWGPFSGGIPLGQVLWEGCCRGQREGLWVGSLGVVVLGRGTLSGNRY